MAFVRFDNDSDVHCWEAYSGGFKILVAGARCVVDDNGDLPEGLSLEERSEYFVKIGLPHDEEEFSYDTIEEMLEQLILLRDMGYLVPDYAIERMETEIEKQKKNL